jgi:hypothetical protein
MSYAVVMVYVEADSMPEQRVRLAAGLAARFDAQLLGLSALAIPPPTVANGVVLAYPAETDVKLMQATLAEKGEWFRRLAGGDSRKPEWRSALDFPIDVLAREARGADLVVIRQKGSGNDHRSVDPGEAILKMGRPTLVVPEGVSTLRAEHVVLGWKIRAKRAERCGMRCHSCKRRGASQLSKHVGKARTKQHWDAWMMSLVICHATASRPGLRSCFGRKARVQLS